MHHARFDGVLFIEGRPKSASAIEPIEIRIGGIVTSGQLRSLDDVKRLMVAKVRRASGNAVIDFRYGQRSVGFFASLFNRDDVVWYGNGTIARVDGTAFA
jgi:hypothetical protein